MTAIFTNTKLNTILTTARCCLGDITCKLYGKARAAMGYEKTLLIAKEISLYILLLETYLIKADCLDDDTVLAPIASRINKLCNCDCSTGTTSSQVSGHTGYSHTTSTHTV